MCNKRRIAIGILVACIVFWCGNVGNSTSTWNPLAILFDPASLPEKAGKVDLLLSIRSQWKWDTLTVKVATIDNLEYKGALSWNVFVKEGDTINYNIEVMIPDYDTSGLVIQFFHKSENSIRTVYRYFVTTGDTLEIYGQKPKPPPPPPPPHYGVPDSLHPLHTRKPSPKYDSLRSKITGIVTDDEKREILERYPLTNADIQVMRFNGEDWTRRRGEYKFVPWDGKTAEELHAETKEQQRIANEKEVEVVFDLRQTEDYEYVKELVPDLTAMDEPGCYRAVVKQRLARIIKSQGIDVALYPNLPGTIQNIIDSIYDDTIKDHDSINEKYH